MRTSQLILYALLVVALLAWLATTLVRGDSRVLRFAGQTQDYGPVPIPPTPTREPFVAPTPFVHPLRSKTLTELQALLQTHDPEAQCEMGIRLDEGMGVAKDPQAARLLFEVAARDNNGCAVTNLGNLAYDQDDYDTAAQYFQKGSELGYPVAFFNRGQVERYGRRNEPEAFKWYLEAAQRGYVPAYYLAGTGYITGRYGPPDKWLAFQWYQLGADAGDEEAIKDLAWFYTYQSDDPDRYQKAMVWLRKAPCSCSDYEIGRLYLKGLGVPADARQAARYFKRAADQGHAQAMTAYANLLRKGQIGSPDLAAALPYYRRAADLGDGEAMDVIAQMTEHGNGVARDPALAARMYAAAAAHCSADALLWLARVSLTGSHNHPKDLDEAVALSGLSIMCGGDVPPAEAIMKPLLIAQKVNTERSNQILHQMMSTIHDYTGNPNFEPSSPLPFIPEGAKTSI